MSDQYSNLTEFPYEVFPYEIIRLIEQAQKTLNFPIDYFGSAILSASSIAIGNTYQVKLKENFISKSNLYLVLVGRAGDVKSHPLNFALKPIEKWDDKSFSTYKSEMEEYNNQGEDVNISKPVYKKYILKDFTPEKLIEIHSFNKRGIAIHSDEFYGWIKNFGRYNKSSEQETYLSLWNGAAISVDRKTEEPIRVPETHLNIVGTTQTRLLKELSKDNRSDNGFIDRFIFAIHDNPRPSCWNDLELDPEIANHYSTMIERLHSLDFTNHEANIVSFTKEAHKHLLLWQNKRRRELFDDEIATSILSKYEVYTLRFSLIIQLCHWSLSPKTNKFIELFAVESAIKLTEYYIVNAIKVRHIISGTNPIDKLTEQRKLIYNSLDKEFVTASILEIGKTNNLDERSIYRFLKNKSIFKCLKKGLYEKIY